jgi:hypothetical protein
MPPPSAGNLGPIRQAPKSVRAPLAGLLLLLVLGAVLGGILLTRDASSAESASPCWKQVIQDWYDNGRLEGTYEPACYTEARKRIPEDIRVYSDLDDQLSRERLAAGRRLASRGRTSDGSRSTAGDVRGGPIGAAFEKTSPQNADSLPVPVLILAGLAFAMVAAASAGLVAKRARAGRSGRPPAA